MKNSSNQQTFRGSALCKSNFQQPPGIAKHINIKDKKEVENDIYEGSAYRLKRSI